MRYVIKFKKGEEVRFVSHLDMLRLFQRAFRRAKLPLAFSQGFNPHPLMSFATALSVGFTSEGEYLDVILTEPVKPKTLMDEVNATLPAGVRIIEVIDAGDNKASLTSLMRYADYDISLRFPSEVDEGALSSVIRGLLAGEIVVDKKTKSGVKPTDIRPLLQELRLIECSGCTARLFMRGVLAADGGLNPELLLKELYKRLGVQAVSTVSRLSIGLDTSELIF